MTFKPSLVILTFNRRETVLRAVTHNLKDAYGIFELIHVDNGSHDGIDNLFATHFETDIQILHKKNLGVAKGYNRGTLLATGSHVVITGCDRLMPKQWLSTLEKYFETIPNTGVISIYSQPIEKLKERLRSKTIEGEIVNGLPIIEAMPMGAKIYRADVLKEAGHLREDFGLYGWEDVEFGYRVERVCKEMGLLTYIIPGFQAEHLGSEGIKEYNGIDNFDYHKFKQEQANDPEKHKLMTKCAEEKYRYYNPYI